MRSFTFEPGDGSFELIVDHEDEVKPEEWKDPATAILKRLEPTRGLTILKNYGEKL